MYYVLVIIFLLIILFLPLRLSVSIIYKDGHISVLIFNRAFNMKEKVSKDKVTPKTAKKAEFNLINFLPSKMRKAIYKLTDCNHKLSSKVKFELNYGFEDAALTGIMYGASDSLNAFIYNQVSYLFKIRKYEYNIVPHFNNEIFNFRLNCIISFNLAKIIYMFFSIYVS